MMRHLSAVLTTLLFAAPATHLATGGSNALTVHEWGTFTSIAGADGAAVAWLPVAGPTDVPCFVERNRFNIKAGLTGTVRMETPVLYFYADHAMTVEVNVRFRQGLITEWFPHAVVTPASGSDVFRSAGTITWRRVQLSPGTMEHFPREARASHYYAARQTEAAPLASGPDNEKFLFYRGVGRFLPPIGATVDGNGTVAVISPPDQPIGDVILFTNDRGRITYEIRRQTERWIRVDPEVVDRAPTAELERLLLTRGLYPAEARAMLDTWRDSWFEEGTRLLYMVPPREIDTILPLQITPTPAAVARVFVGRMELVTPRMLEDVKAALVADDVASLRKYGRFLDAIGNRIVAQSPRDQAALFVRRLRAVSPILMPAEADCPAPAIRSTTATP